jgi:hypothetical protein
MPRLPKTDPALARKPINGKPVKRVRKPRVSVPGVRQNASRSDGAARAPVAPAGLILDAEEAGAGLETGPQVGRPADRLISDETLAAAAALDSPAGQAANGSSPENPAPSASAPPAGDLTIEQCTADAAELIEFAWSSIEAAQIALPKRTHDTLAKKKTRASIASATGRLFHHYGLAGTDIISNPWAGLALAFTPVAIAAFMDWRDAKATEATAAPAAAPVAPRPAGGNIAEAGAPPSPLAGMA